MKKKINKVQRNTVIIDTSFPQQPNNYIQMTEWANHDGIDIEICRRNGTIYYQLTYNELDAIADGIKELNEK